MFEHSERSEVQAATPRREVRLTPCPGSGGLGTRRARRGVVAAGRSVVRDPVGLARGCPRGL